MIEVNIPGRPTYELKYLVLDLNGTIACDGDLLEGVEERLNTLSRLINLFIITADTQGKAQELRNRLQIKLRKINPHNEQVQKLELVQQLGSQNTVAIGNGTNDAFMLRESILGICVLGSEGASIEALTNCDIVVPDINSALDLLIKPERLIATLRR